MTFLRLVAYNLERGLKLDRQIELLRRHPRLAGADVYLLCELDRGCARTGSRHVARELAEALGLYWAWAVQYVELPSPARRREAWVDGIGGHGVAILSRYPLCDVQVLKARRRVDWRGHPREPRLGGIVTLAARIDTGLGPVQCLATHLDSRPHRDDFRRAQARELAAFATRRGGSVVIGGDLNCYRYLVDLICGSRQDPPTAELRRAGFRDAHDGLPWHGRLTTTRRWGLRAAIDLFFVRELAVRDRGVLGLDEAGDLSDHLPVWAEVGRP